MCCFIQINILILHMWFMRFTKGAFHLIGFHKYSYSMVWKYRDWRRSLPFDCVLENKFDSSFLLVRVCLHQLTNISPYVVLNASNENRCLSFCLCSLLAIVLSLWYLQSLLVVFIKYFNISLSERHINYTTVI